MSFRGSSLALSGKGALLTALNYSAVRSHQAVCVRPVLRCPKRGRAEGGIHRRVPSVKLEPEQRKERALFTGLRGRVLLRTSLETAF